MPRDQHGPARVRALRALCLPTKSLAVHRARGPQGVLAVGWMWLRLASAALAEAVTLRRRVEAGAESLMALPAEALLRE